MEASKVFYRRATAESPLTVYYFTPTHIDRKPQPLHRSNAFMFLLMHTGEVEFYTTTGMVLLDAGDICIVPPRMLHSFRTVHLQTEYTLFCLNPGLFSLPASHFFSREFWQPLQSGKLHPPLVLQPGEDPHEALRVQMQRLDVEKEGSATYTMELLGIAMNLCVALYPYCSREDTPELTNPGNHSVSDLCMQYISKHYRQKITLEDIAQHVHLHPNYLCALFREQTGKTIFEHLTWKRVHEASKLLRSTDLPITQIATRCGFQSPTFFSRKFKEILGTTPTVCRKQSRTRK